VSLRVLCGVIPSRVNLRVLYGVISTIADDADVLALHSALHRAMCACDVGHLNSLGPLACVCPSPQVTKEIRDKASEAFLDAHMADVKTWSINAIAKQLSKHRLVELCVCCRLHPPA
jgi:hypothetical protein